MRIEIALIYDQLRWEEKTILEAAKSNIKLVDSKTIFLELNREKAVPHLGDVVLQRCVSFFRSLHLTAVLESKGYMVINPYRVSNLCGNKLLTTLALDKAGVPTPKTLVAFTSKSALAALDKLGYPAMLKPVVGSWGRLIIPLKDAETAEAVLEEREYMFPLYHIYYLQDMIKRPPRDIRVIVVGEEAVAAMYRYSFLDLKTNIARGGKPEYCQITNEIRELSLKAAEAVGGGILGVDMMETEEGGLTVHEINHTVEFHAVATTTKLNIAKYIVGYLIRKAKK